VTTLEGFGLVAEDRPPLLYDTAGPMKLLLVFTLALLGFTASESARAGGRLAPDPLTQEDHESLATLQQQVSNLRPLAAADSAFNEQRWQAAAALYASLSLQDEDAARYPLRRRCQALTELGRRAEALVACEKLLHTVLPNAADLQAHLQALMLGAGRPSDAELQQATVLVRRIEGMDPDSVWAEAARCAVAERIGDRSTLALCSAALARLSPEGRLTQRFAPAAQASLSARWLRLGVLGALLLAALLTLGHSFVTRRKGAVVASACLLLCGWARPAAAQDSATTPESSITAEPNTAAGTDASAARSEDEAKAIDDEMAQVQAIIEKIAAAEALITEKNDWQSAVAKYNEIIVTVPYMVKAWRRLCEGYSYLGMPVEGAHSCRQVLASKEANAWDRAMLVHHLLTGPDRAKPEVLAEAKALAAEAAATSPNERWGHDAQCELALRANDLPALNACSKQLDILAHDDRKTVAMLFSVALAERRFADAEQLIERARAGGMEEASLQRMRLTLRQREPLTRRIRGAVGARSWSGRSSAGSVDWLRAERP
jgi:hypothetical protein